jgi:hypothetical protein
MFDSMRLKEVLVAYKQNFVSKHGAKKNTNGKP